MDPEKLTNTQNYDISASSVAALLAFQSLSEADQQKVLDLLGIDPVVQGDSQCDACEGGPEL